ncbi:MAG: efflux RND transporter periplasmic adaptor subunit, partial [Myxococcales bacterium]|nr:efflux RND transporter periplasmic adaptor subunit [Myxococcales bacterium]
MARAAIAEARAALSGDETNLHKASIRSPIDGVVLTRKVEPGQTVAAMLQAPVLFVLAEDLASMELRVDVDEADVGRVRAGQRATFSVDAYPRRTFEARIVRVGLGSQVKEGVVSYPTVLAVRNDDLALRPGMTVTCEIVTARRDGALLLPNAALRFSPAAATQRRRRRRGLVSDLLPRPPHVALKKPTAQKTQVGGSARVWVLRAGELASLQITVGESDGRETEVLGGALRDGDRVVVGGSAGGS